MYSAIKQGDKSTIKLSEFVIDSPEDVATLPTNCDVGSTAICIATAQVFILSNSKEWKEL